MRSANRICAKKEKKKEECKCSELFSNPLRISSCYDFNNEITWIMKDNRNASHASNNLDMALMAYAIWC